MQQQQQKCLKIGYEHCPAWFVYFMGLRWSLYHKHEDLSAQVQQELAKLCANCGQKAAAGSGTTGSRLCKVCHKKKRKSASRDAGDVEAITETFKTEGGG